MATREKLIRLAVFGSPISQSLSPTIHQQFAAQFDLQIDYRAIESAIDEFPGRLSEFAAGGGLGCNITAPLKQAAYRAAHELSPAAKRAEAVNTLHLLEPGSWFGTTTDGAGLLRDLLRLLPGGLKHRRILLVGAGGAAAGVIEPLLNEIPAQLIVANRSLDKAQDLCERFRGLGPISANALADLQPVAPFDLLLNATSLGHRGQTPELPVSCYGESSFCYDLNYGTAAQAWQKECTARGAQFSDGLGMLVEQAALSFELWTGYAPQTASVLSMLRQHISQK